MVTSLGPCCAATVCRLLLAEIPRGVDRNSELKLRLHLSETVHISDVISKVVGQQNSGDPSAKPTRDWWAAPRRALLTVAETGPQLSFRGAEAARNAPAGGRYKLAARDATRGQGRTRTGVASLLHVKLSFVSAPGPTDERQEHADAVVSFAGAGQRRRLFWGSTFSQSSGRQETCRKNAASCSTHS